MSQHTNINESIVVMRRHAGTKPTTRFINLDKMPTDESEVEDLHRCLLECEQGDMANGWGQVSYWPAERIEAGDWTPAIWRSPALAEAAMRFANHKDLQILKQIDALPSDTGPTLRVHFKSENPDFPGIFPIIKSRGAEGQRRIQSQPDDYVVPKRQDEDIRKANGGTYPEAGKILRKAGHLLITSGQRNSTARLIAVASEGKFVGDGWMPVTGLSSEEAKAAGVFLNSTLGRLQMMRNTRRTLAFPAYSVDSIANIRIPNVKDDRIRGILSACWERTKDMEVPQFRDGECEVRRLWDEAVAEAMGWDAAELGRLRLLLHQEPHVRGLGYRQYADELDIYPADRERFTELADQWERETVFLSNPNRIAAHPAHQEIVSMGEPAVPLVMERMRAQGGHWFYALRDITGANPIQPADRGKVSAMQEAWLEWGEANGYA